MITVEISEKKTEEEGVVHYSLEFTRGDYKWTQVTRYSELKTLHHQISKFLKYNKTIEMTVMDFPPKKWWVTRDNTFLSQRKKNLEEYLAVLLRQPEAMKVEPLVEFINRPQVEDKSRRASEEAAIGPPIQAMTSFDDANRSGEKDQSSILHSPQMPLFLLTDEYGSYREGQVRMSGSSMIYPYARVACCSFNEDIGSIKKKSIDLLSDSENNSSLILFLQTPKRGGSSLLQSAVSVGTAEAIATIAAIMSNSNYEEDYSDSGSNGNIGSFTSESSSSDVRLEQQCKATQRKYIQEIEQINELNEISSEIEQNVFFDSDEDASSSPSPSISHKRSEPSSSSQLVRSPKSKATAKDAFAIRQSMKIAQDEQNKRIEGEGESEDCSSSRPLSFRSDTEEEESSKVTSSSASFEQYYNNSHILRDLSLCV